jgi:hypothetical protein
MKFRVAIAATAVLALSGCATIFNGQHQPVAIQSVPEGATVTVTNLAGEKVHSATTPTTVTLKRGAGYFRSESYKLVFTKEGHATREITISGTMSGWYIGNILFGGLIGMLAVDPVTGGMYIFPESVSETLTAEAPKTSQGERSLTIVSMDSLTAEQREQARLLIAAK